MLKTRNCVPVLSPGIHSILLIKCISNDNQIKIDSIIVLLRHRMAEISFVLKALATLIVSLKKAPIDSVEPHVWDLLIRLYPHIVDCTTSNSAQVNRSLREVLHEYSDLLSPPSMISSKSMRNGC